MFTAWGLQSGCGQHGVGKGGSLHHKALRGNRIRAEIDRNLDLRNVWEGNHPAEWEHVKAGLIAILQVDRRPGNNIVEDLQLQQLSHEEKADLFRVVAHCGTIRCACSPQDNHAAFERYVLSGFQVVIVLKHAT